MTDVTIERDASIVGWEINGWLPITDAWLEMYDIDPLDQKEIVAVVQREFGEALRLYEPRELAVILSKQECRKLARMAKKSDLERTAPQQATYLLRKLLEDIDD